MKKITILIISFMAISFIAFSQNCTYCNGNTIAWENFSSALGIENTSTGQASFASGKYDTVTGNYSTGLGFRAIATGETSFAAGGISKATGIGAMSFGHHIKSSGYKSFVIGTGGSSTGLLINNNDNSLMIGFGSSKPTLFVSTASASDKTGRIGIGDVTNPAAKLHIKTDYGEQSVMFIEPWTWDSNQWSEIRIGTQNHAIRASYYYGLEFKTENNYIFNSTDAKVGIGTNTPTEKLEIEGNIKQSAGYFVSTDKIQATGTNGLKLYNQAGSGLYINTAGNLGIGTVTPQEKLHVAGNGLVTGNLDVSGDITATTYTGDGSALTNVDDNDWTVNGNDVYRQYGNVGIGTQYPSKKLEVAGDIKATGKVLSDYIETDEILIHGPLTVEADADIQLDLNVYGKIEAGEIEVKDMKAWKDEVFDEEYNLRTLQETEQFIKENGHLPDIPSETEVLENGINVGEMNALLLQKIEELTLYVIELEKKMENMMKSSR